MSRWYRTDEEQRGYDAGRAAERWTPYPYERSHDYREGWDDALREERRERDRQEAEQAEREAYERRLERAQHLSEEYADTQFGNFPPEQFPEEPDK